MSAAQREAIAQEQLGQVLARRAAAAQAAAEEAAAAAEQHNIHRAVMQQVRGWLSRAAPNSSTSGPLQGRGQLQSAWMHVAFNFGVGDNMCWQTMYRTAGSYSERFNADVTSGSSIAHTC
jgi:hypothetical protein